jgi:hypothetical protein
MEEWMWFLHKQNLKQFTTWKVLRVTATSDMHWDLSKSNVRAMLKNNAELKNLFKTAA